MCRDNLMHCVIPCFADTSWYFVTLCYSRTQWGDFWIWDCLLVLKGIKKNFLLLFNDTFIRMIMSRNLWLQGGKGWEVCAYFGFFWLYLWFYVLNQNNTVQPNFFFMHSVNPLPCRGGQLSWSPGQIASSGRIAETLYTSSFSWSISVATANKPLRFLGSTCLWSREDSKAQLTGCHQWL